MTMKTWRAPTPSGLYGLKCANCGTYFGSVRKDTEFCKHSCRGIFSRRRYVLRDRRYQQGLAQVKAVMLDDSLSATRPPAPLRGWSAARHPLTKPLESERSVEEDPESEY